MNQPITIVIRERFGDFMAYKLGSPAIWGRGQEADDAIADVLRSHPEEFGINIVRERDLKEHKDVE